MSILVRGALPAIEFLLLGAFLGTINGNYENVVRALLAAVSLLSVCLLVAVPAEGRPLLRPSAKLFLWTSLLGLFASVQTLPKFVVTDTAFALAYCSALTFGSPRNWFHLWATTVGFLALIWAGGLVEFIPSAKPEVLEILSPRKVAIRFCIASGQSPYLWESEYAGRRWQNALQLGWYRDPLIVLSTTGIVPRRQLESEADIQITPCPVGPWPLELR